MLIDPEGDHESLGKTLYPRDFIMALPKPEGHMGLNEFSRIMTKWIILTLHKLQLCRLKAQELREYEDDEKIPDFNVPTSLENAIIDFLLSGAARLCRGHENFHHSMLIHTKHTIKISHQLLEK